MRQQLLKKYTILIARTGQTPITLSFTPMSVLPIVLLATALPLGWLATVMFSLTHSNLKLSQENRQLTEKAQKVLTELDTLDSEIENLRERAGLPDGENSEAPGNPTIDLRGRISSDIPPRGGVSLNENQGTNVDGLTLYELAEERMPALNATLDLRVKPALERTLDAEASEAEAFPNGKPLTIPLVITSEFGLRRNPFGGKAYEKHEGIDFQGPYGTPIVATGAGRVKQAGYYGGFGNTVIIDHSYGNESLYAHMSKVTVDAGEVVQRGDLVGYLGSSGRSSGPHLHYGIYHQGQAVNPRQYLELSKSSSLADYWRLR
jgi:murein DD-endopeptidase MepM/ murein hydrolase activator NlpD